MSFFNPKQPILCPKDIPSDVEKLAEMKCINFQILKKTPLSEIYTCIDQAFVIWGLIAGLIFITAQFFPISWLNQAIIWSILTIVGTGAMIFLTYSWVKLEQLKWVLYLWVVLMLSGLLITDLGIFCGWGLILINLCNLWLFLSAIGYFLTGFGLRSRALFLAALIHALGMFLLPMVWKWQFLFTGLIMVSNLWLFAEKQWDRLLPRDIAKVKTHSSKLNQKIVTTVKERELEKWLQEYGDSYVNSCQKIKPERSLNFQTLPNICVYSS